MGMMAANIHDGLIPNGGKQNSNASMVIGSTGKHDA